MSILWIPIYTTDLQWETPLAESLSGVSLLSRDFYKHHRPYVFGVTEYRLQMDPEVWHTTRPTPDSDTEGAVLLDEAEIAQWLKTQSESSESGKIFVVIPEDISSENVIVGIKRE